MSLRRVLVSFLITFACALAVFTLPRFVWNTVQSARAQQPPAAAPATGNPATAPPSSVQAAPAPAPPGSIFVLKW